MPVTPTYPGVYIQEQSSGVHPIVGVATSIAAFVGFAERGPVNAPTTVLSFADYTRTFGGLWAVSMMSYAVNQFFGNGGTVAVIVRPVHAAGAQQATKGSLTIGTGTGKLMLEAANEGQWSSHLLVRVDHHTSDPATTFNLSIKDTSTGTIEVLRNLAPGATLAATVAQRSQLVTIVAPPPTAQPPAHADGSVGSDPFDPSAPTQYTAFPSSGAGLGKDGDLTQEADLIPGTDDGTGVYALAQADLFNLLCIPPANATTGAAISTAAKGRAAAFCRAQRAMFIVDSDPNWTDPVTIASPGGLDIYTSGIAAEDRPYAALYFPYVRAPDPLQNNAVVDFPPCGLVAGVMAQTDAARGVWKAPAGLDAGLAGIQDLQTKLTNAQNGILNPIAVNCLRTFPASGSVVWGARTLAGADALASEWKYVPVRRTASYLEESLLRGTQWVVFEPNDEPLWASIRLNVGSFMQDLFRKGAFQGTTPQDAYLVKCDSDTTTQVDVNNGVVNILVGFAPLQPAEFVIITIQQLAGQTQS